MLTLRLKICLLATAFLFANIASASPVKHSSIKATETLSQFLNASFIDENYAKAYSLSDHNFKKGLSLNKFKKLALAIKKPGDSFTVSHMQITNLNNRVVFYVTKSPSKSMAEHFLYMIMSGSEKDGYTVSGMYISNVSFLPKRLTSPLVIK